MAGLQPWRVFTDEFSTEAEYRVEMGSIYAVDMSRGAEEGPPEGSAEYRISRVVGTNDKCVYAVELCGHVAEYTPGDSLLVKVGNDVEETEALLQWLALDAEASLKFRRVHKRTGRIVFAHSGTVGGYFRHYFDMASLPSKAMLLRLGEKCRDEDGRKRLTYLASREGSRDYFRMHTRWNRLLDILEEFGSFPALEDLLELGMEIRPRAFSLINRAGASSEFLAGTIAKKDAERADRLRYGHVSAFIRRNFPAPHSGDRLVPVGVKANRQMSMPVALRPGSRFLLLCAGTGVAPFISFLRNSAPLQQMALFYGCRSPGESILHATGIVDGDGKRCSYTGARRFAWHEKPNVEIYIVYSREDECLHMDQFLAANLPLMADSLLCGLTEVFICGRKELQASLSSQLKNLDPQGEKIAVRVDDWL